MSSDERNLAFGRLLGVCVVMGERVFEKGKASIGKNEHDKFPRKPVSTFKKIHEDLMKYSHKFGRDEDRLLNLISEVIGGMNENDFTDEPLGDKYLLGYYKQKHELNESGI